MHVKEHMILDGLFIIHFSDRAWSEVLVIAFLYLVKQ